MSKKIIGISTSPREGSNSRIALEAALEQAATKGAETKIYDINQMNITDCQADNYCKAHNGECPVDDDMQQLYTAIKECDGIILAAPVYFMDTNAITRRFIDRLYAFYMTPFAETYGTKKFGLIISQGAPETDTQFPAATENTTTAFKLLGFEPVATELFGGNNAPSNIAGDDEALARARKVGDAVL